MRHKKPKIEKVEVYKNCLICGASFPSRQYPTKMYCSKKCRVEAIVPKNILRGIVPAKNMGAYSELKVMLDLFKKGYEVYRAVSQHCSGDIVIEKGNLLIKIDATTGFINNNGTYAFPPKKAPIVIAVYLADKDKVVYLNNNKEEINL